jgi:hypothetical protein
MAALRGLSGFEPRARFVAFHSEDRQICLPIDRISKQNAILALRTGGRWLAAGEGGPCRLVLQGSRWRDFGGPVDRIQVCVERPVTATAPHAHLKHSSRESASAA